jgi:hypothetical protein
MSHEKSDTIFDEYKKIWDKQIKENVKENYSIDILFLYSDNNIHDEYVINDDKLISKCVENYWHSLLIKTINGFKYGYEKNYDYVFKTNLSTIINYPKFYEYCNNIDKNRKYVYDGMVGRYYDYQFCSGAGMLLNKNSIKIILDNMDKISVDWTDDIFIGYILNKLHNISPCSALTRFDIITHDAKIKNEIIKEHTHVRIKVRKGDYDIYFTNLIYNILHG